MDQSFLNIIRLFSVPKYSKIPENGKGGNSE